MTAFLDRDSAVGRAAAAIDRWGRPWHRRFKIQLARSSAVRVVALGRFIGYYSAERPHLGIGGRALRQRLRELLAA